ncbi:hypothetical protein DPEC_G00028730 [Dallia pectoralis]|uniref:Uncharacterized protein n=1 Tax=Dallia pectoralis TaxID=75939 RepID=A0ACC2HIW6_DALPE|nr:hypothetical protein DPEC_G00028730 [Dallia pectoralis]
MSLALTGLVTSSYSIPPSVTTQRDAAERPPGRRDETNKHSQREHCRTLHLEPRSDYPDDIEVLKTERNRHHHLNFLKAWVLKRVHHNKHSLFDFLRANCTRALKQYICLGGRRLTVTWERFRIEKSVVRLERRYRKWNHQHPGRSFESLFLWSCFCCPDEESGEAVTSLEDNPALLVSAPHDAVTQPVTSDL